MTKYHINKFKHLIIKRSAFFLQLPTFNLGQSTRGHQLLRGDGTREQRWHHQTTEADAAHGQEVTSQHCGLSTGVAHGNGSHEDGRRGCGGVSWSAPILAAVALQGQ